MSCNRETRSRNASHKKSTKITKYNIPASMRLDSLVPKPKDILENIKKDEEIKQLSDKVKESSTYFYKICDSQNKVDTEKEVMEIPNCKHLTLHELEELFAKDVDFIDGVIHGRIFSSRHELFKTQLPSSDLMKNDLRVCSSFDVFTQEQRIHIVSLFRRRFDQGDMYKYSDYYFKVLLPEYCLKIFKDYYNLSTEEAMDYLNSIPVPEYL